MNETLHSTSTNIGIRIHSSLISGLDIENNFIDKHKLSKNICGAISLSANQLTLNISASLNQTAMRSSIFFKA